MTDSADDILREYAQASGNRSTWESHWQEIAERCLPAYSKSFTPNSYTTPGEKRTEKVFDSTAPVALGRFASVIDSLLTPQRQKWHRLRASNDDVQKIRAVRLYFEQANDVLFRQRYAPQANFASQNHEVFTSMGAFGTGALFCDAMKGSPGLRYRGMHLGGIYFLENHQGIVDQFLRRFSYTGRQAMQRWGKVLPDTVKTQAEKDPNRLFWFIHCVKPNAEYDSRRADAKGMKFASYYVSESGKLIVERGGYRTFPMPISRYKTAPGEIYGRSPGMDVLPAMKTLNEQKKTVLKQGHRTVDPVLLAHDDGIVDGMNITPGAVNYGGVNEQGRPLVHTLPVGNIAIGKDLMDDERAVINDAFLVTLFQILIESPQMTATEVIERVKEKGMLLAPTVGRQESEYCGPLIDRELDVLSQQGLLPPMPPELLEAEGEYTVLYDSPMARAARAEEASGIMRTVETALSIAAQTQDMSILDTFDFDVIIPEVAEIQGVPMRWMRSPEDIAALREERQAAMDAQMAIQAAPGVAALSKANTAAQESVGR